MYQLQVKPFGSKRWGWTLYVSPYLQPCLDYAEAFNKAEYDGVAWRIVNGTGGVVARGTFRVVCETCGGSGSVNEGIDSPWEPASATRRECPTCSPSVPAVLGPVDEESMNAALEGVPF